MGAHKSDVRIHKPERRTRPDRWVGGWIPRRLASFPGDAVGRADNTTVSLMLVRGSSMYVKVRATASGGGPCGATACRAPFGSA